VLVTQLGSSWVTEFGCESGLLALVTQWEANEHVPPWAQVAAPVLKVLTHPCGNAGGTTPSKLSDKNVMQFPSGDGGWGDAARAVGSVQMISALQKRVAQKKESGVGHLNGIFVFTLIQTFGRPGTRSKLGSR
jgi:hypothetical protein